MLRDGKASTLQFLQVTLGGTKKHKECVADKQERLVISLEGLKMAVSRTYCNH